MIRRFEFSSFEDAENTIVRFIEFYNNERLHTAIDYKAPREVVGKYIRHHCTSQDVKMAIDFAFLDRICL